MLWNQFILSRAVARVARCVLAKAAAAEAPEGAGELVSFCFTDTHAGSGRLPAPLPGLRAVLERRAAFTSPVFFSALDERTGAEKEKAGEAPWHPGSWVLAGRVLDGLGEPRLAVEIDVNDIDPAVVAAATAHREGHWVRFWAHDWFLFLRSRLALARPPHFVFIDPPADDARGLAYAIDAAILLDTLGIPYLVTYGFGAPQEVIDEIGRSGLELLLPPAQGGGGCGVLLGGGAETVLLDILPDLRTLAAALDGMFSVRLPGNLDYMI